MSTIGKREIATQCEKIRLFKQAQMQEFLKKTVILPRVYCEQNKLREL
jgi:hypothetical protein